jgi:hypothetical protein
VKGLAVVTTGIVVREGRLTPARRLSSIPALWKGAGEPGNPVTSTMLLPRVTEALSPSQSVRLTAMAAYRQNMDSTRAREQGPLLIDAYV